MNVWDDDKEQLKRRKHDIELEQAVSRTNDSRANLENSEKIYKVHF